MINTLGSLSLIWLILWFALTLLFGLIYPVLRVPIMRLQPAHGSALLLLYWAMPVLMAFAASLMLFSPASDHLLVAPHCHGSCVTAAQFSPHAPQTEELPIALAGLLLALLAAVALLGSFIYNLRRGGRMNRQFEALTRRGRGYRVLDAQEPVVFTLGWWNPQVFISQGLIEHCSGAQLDVILAHEQAHRQRRDNLRLLLARVFALVLPSGMRQQLMHDLQILCEQACDFAAAEKYGAIPVAETLVHVGRLVNNAMRPPGAVAFDGGDLSVRVHALLSSDARVSLRFWQLLLMFSALVYVLLLTLDPLHHGAEWLIGWLDAVGLHGHHP